MKTSLTLGSLAMLLLFTSCEKKYCFNCFTTTYVKETTDFQGQSSVSTSEIEEGPDQICDKTDDDADAYEAANSAGTRTTTQGSTVTETSVTTRCSR